MINKELDTIRATLRILFIEDNPKDVKLMVAALERSGYQLEFDVVDSPSSLREQLLRQQHEIIIRDGSAKLDQVGGVARDVEHLGAGLLKRARGVDADHLA